MAWTSQGRDLPPNWQAIRRRILHRDPICRVCGERPSTQVDHVVPGDDHRDSNLQGICDPCHATKSSEEGNRAHRDRHR